MGGWGGVQLLFLMLQCPGVIYFTCHVASRFHNMVTMHKNTLVILVTSFENHMSFQNDSLYLAVQSSSYFLFSRFNGYFFQNGYLE